MSNISADLRSLLDQIHKNIDDMCLRFPAAEKAQDDGLDSLANLLGLMSDERFLRSAAILATGSRTYGAFTENSDYDWVVGTIPYYRVEMVDDVSFIISQIRSNCNPHSSGMTAPPPSDDYPEYRLTGSYRFGPVNIIHVSKREQWRTWEAGTQQLVEEKNKHGPRSRKRAIQVFTEMAKKYIPRRVLDVPSPNRDFATAFQDTETNV